MGIDEAWHDPLPETKFDKVDVFKLPVLSCHGVLDGRTLDVVEDPFNDAGVGNADQRSGMGLNLPKSGGMDETAVDDSSCALHGRVRD